MAKIKKHKLCKGGKTKFINVTLPPLRDKNVTPKYQDSGKRLVRLVPELETVALKQSFDVVSINHLKLIGLDIWRDFNKIIKDKAVSKTALS